MNRRTPNLGIEFNNEDVLNYHVEDWELENAERMFAANVMYSAFGSNFQEVNFADPQYPVDYRDKQDMALEVKSGRVYYMQVKRADLRDANILTVSIDNKALTAYRTAKIDGFVFIVASVVTDDSGPFPIVGLQGSALVINRDNFFRLINEFNMRGNNRGKYTIFELYTIYHMAKKAGMPVVFGHEFNSNVEVYK